MSYAIGIILTLFMIWLPFRARLSVKIVIIEILSYIVGLLVGLLICYEAIGSYGLALIIAAVASYFAVGSARRSVARIRITTTIIDIPSCLA